MSVRGASLAAAEAIHDLDASALPPSAIEAVQAHVVDSLGLIIAGADSDRVRRGLDALPDDPAFALSLACGALGLDDFDEDTRAHPSAVLLPAVLTAADGHHQPVPGADLIAGLVAGYQLLAGLGEAMDARSMHPRGRHPSAVLGVPGAAVAAARALGTDAAGIAAALGVGAAFSCGLTVFDEQESMRAVQTAWAASTGVRAARLARAGFPASPYAIDGPGGLLGDRPHPALELIRWPPYAVERVSLKVYPHFSDLHPVTFALVQAIGGRRIDPRAVRSVRARTVVAAGERLSWEWPPASVRAAKRSAGFVLASCLRYAPTASATGLLDALRAERLSEPETVALGARVELRADLSAGEPDAPVATVQIELEDGRMLTGTSRGYPGDGRDPDLRCTVADAQARFDGFAGAAAGVREEQSRDVLDGALGLADLADVRPWARACLTLLTQSA
jgi:2-methylcitrate dehydratase PrpD